MNEGVEIGLGVHIREFFEDALTSPHTGEPVVYERDAHGAYGSGTRASLPFGESIFSAAPLRFQREFERLFDMIDQSNGYLVPNFLRNLHEVLFVSLG